MTPCSLVDIDSQSHFRCGTLRQTAAVGWGKAWILKNLRAELSLQSYVYSINILIYYIQRPTILLEWAGHQACTFKIIILKHLQGWACGCAPIFHHSAQLHSPFCQTSSCPSRTRQVVERPKLMSTQPRCTTTCLTLYNFVTTRLHYNPSESTSGHEGKLLSHV